jgi:hypothetical protein
MIKRFLTNLLVRRSRKALTAFTAAREELASINTALTKNIEANKKAVEKIHAKNVELALLTDKHSRVIQNITKFLED